MPDRREVLDRLSADLAVEQAALDDRVAGLDDAVWQTPTPAAGWNIRDQISHLWYFDGTARLALTDPSAFSRQTEELLGVGASDASPAVRSPDVTVGADLTGPALLHRWRDGRRDLLDAVAAAASADPVPRIPWYGPAMSLSSFVTARLMETWAHGTDVSDALGLAPVVSDRLRHVCHIGVGARAYSFAVRGRQDRGEPVRVEVTGPAGDLWAWGPPDAPDRVTGPALDVALVLTQRRHPADTAVVVEGPTATAWIAVAQAFAGPPGPGRPPGGPTHRTA